MTSIEICRDQYETALEFIGKGWDCSVQVQTIENVMERMAERGQDTQPVKLMLQSIGRTKDFLGNES